VRTNNRFREKHQEVISHMPANRLTGHRVLVVDDNRMVANSIAETLELQGAEVRVADNGPFAITICEQWSPTAALVDIRMPGMDGCEVARRLRARWAGAFRLIALSGEDLHASPGCAKTAGFDDLLTKPVRLTQLIAVLSSES
jgi:CheY-like chemotaxis protein